MDVASHRRRARRISPLNQSGGVVASQTEAGIVRLERVTIDPSNVSPRGTIQVQADLRETGEVVGPGPELCAPGGTFGSGVAAIVTMTPSWGHDQAEEEVCIPVFSLSTGRKSVSFQFEAPTLREDEDQRRESLQTKVQIRGHPDRFATTTDEIIVSRSGRTDPRDDKNGNGNGGGGGGGPLLPCFLDPNRNCSSFENMAWGLSGVFVLSMVLD